jgi:hypothetical protein
MYVLLTVPRSNRCQHTPRLHLHRLPLQCTHSSIHCVAWYTVQKHGTPFKSPYTVHVNNTARLERGKQDNDFGNTWVPNLPKCQISPISPELCFLIAGRCASCHVCARLPCVSTAPLAKTTTYTKLKRRKTLRPSIWICNKVERTSELHSHVRASERTSERTSSVCLQVPLFHFARFFVAFLRF